MSISEYYENLLKVAQPGERVFIHRGTKNSMGHAITAPRINPNYPNMPLIELYYIPSGKKGIVRIEELKFNGWEEYSGAPILQHVKSAQEREAEMRAEIEAEIRAKISAEMSANDDLMKAAPLEPQPQAIDDDTKASPVKRRRGRAKK
jgi:hypothetical protein